MESILGGCAFAGIIAAQLFAVVAVHNTKRGWRDVRKGRSPALGQGQLPATNGREIDLTVHSVAASRGRR